MQYYQGDTLRKRCATLYDAVMFKKEDVVAKIGAESTEILLANLRVRIGMGKN